MSIDQYDLWKLNNPPEYEATPRVDDRVFRRCAACGGIMPYLYAPGSCTCRTHDPRTGGRR